ncbi:hypothetical protein [uncultured Pseudokineococcus sp.]|uniref:hypothetical protein n=1 Tax=uncultured Pseudokineococcus sp. TaxID=1642928 RepID=UPI0026083554|nr:hypothetical protein [uncultured Pseudokineococcus sp.]
MPEPDDVRRHPAVRRTRRRTAAGWVGIAVLALAGLVALGLGTAQRTVWLPDDQVSATASTGGGDTPARLVVTAPGVLETRPGPVTVTATSSDGGPVVLVLGRETDVTAWTAGVPTAVVGGLEAPTTLAVDPPAAAAEGAPVEGAPADVASVDPADAPGWEAVAEGEGSATLEVEPPEGRWLVLAASDGAAAAPEELRLTWPQEVVTPLAVPLLVGGGAALLAAVLLALVHARTTGGRHRRAVAAATADAPEAAGAGAPEGSSPWAPAPPEEGAGDPDRPAERADQDERADRDEEHR